MNWLEYFGNPRNHMLKKTMYDVLKDRYPKNEEIIERISSVLITENDSQSFMKLVSDIYEIAYLKSVEDHREQLEKMGLKAKVVPNNS